MASQRKPKKKGKNASICHICTFFIYNTDHLVMKANNVLGLFVFVQCILISIKMFCFFLLSITVKRNVIMASHL